MLYRSLVWFDGGVCRGLRFRFLSCAIGNSVCECSLGFGAGFDKLKYQPYYDSSPSISSATPYSPSPLLNSSEDFLFLKKVPLEVDFLY
jgi:hypothetical protein